MEWEATARSDRGLKRPHNEDAVLLRVRRGVFAVADGMGGHAAGEVASGLAVETLDQRTRELDVGETTSDELMRRLGDAVRAANRAILDRGEEEPRVAGMGTTLTTVVMAPAERACAVAHIGDSRVYLLRAGRLAQLTVDHTWVQEQVDEGLLTRAQARRHPFSSVLTRALGAENEPDVDAAVHELSADDLLLICTDGLTAMIDDADLREILDAGDDIEATADRLVAAANERGGNDNVTIVLCRVAGDPPRARS